MKYIASVSFGKDSLAMVVVGKVMVGVVEFAGGELLLRYKQWEIT